MSNEQTDDFKIYSVLLNEEGQYSIWPSTKELPAGWRSVGRDGQKDECLQYIEEVWTDMRPTSLVVSMSQ